MTSNLRKLSYPTLHGALFSRSRGCREAYLVTSIPRDWSNTLLRTFWVIFGGAVDHRSFLKPCNVYHHIWTACDTCVQDQLLPF